METDKDAPAEELTKAERRRSQDLLIRFTTTATVSGSLVTSLGSLFLLQLGATPMHLGVLTTLSSADKLIRAWGLQLMGRLGKAQLMFWGRISSLVPGAALVLLALWGDAGGRVVWVALALLALRGVLQHLGNTAWWPLVQDNTAGDALGAFLTRMRLRQRSVELLLPLLVGAYLGAQPSARRFALPFALGLVSMVLAAFWARQVSERRQAASQQKVWQRLWQVLRLAPIRSYARLLMTRNFITSMSFPFWVVALTDRGMPVSYFVWMFSVMALGNLAGLVWWGRLVDAHGFRAVLTLTLTGLSATGCAWFYLPTDVLLLTLWAGGLHFFTGLLEGGLQMGQTKAMVDIVPEERQGEGFVILMYAFALGGGVGGIMGGYTFEWTSQLDRSTWDWPLVYLAGMQFAHLGMWYMSRGLKGYREQVGLVELVRRLSSRTDRHSLRSQK